MIERNNKLNDSCRRTGRRPENGADHGYYWRLPLESESSVQIVKQHRMLFTAQDPSTSPQGLVIALCCCAAAVVRQHFEDGG